MNGEKEIQQYLNLKNTRAVDRIFTQNRLDNVHSIFQSIQENKKANTHALRQTLQKNYEKMIHCSELLDEIKDFGNGVSVVAEKIVERIQNSKKHKKIWGDKDIVECVESKIRNRRFVEAIKICKNPSENVSYQILYYLEYLQVQIINKLEKYLHRKLTKEVISEAAECLQIFINSTDKNKLEFICMDYSEQSLLGTIRNFIFQNEKYSILQIIFKFKITLLRTCEDKEALESYFSDLYSLLNHCEDGDMNKFKEIFLSNVSTIKIHLTQIFVYKQDDGLLIFKNELYDSLLKSRKFEEILQNFHKKITQYNPQISNIENPIIYLHELWKNYVLNLVDYLVEEVDPTKFIELIKKNPFEEKNMPEELKIYIYDNSLDQSLEAIDKYEGKLEILKKNMIETINRCNTNEKQKMKSRFSSNRNELLAKCLKSLSQLEEKQNKLSFRKYIVLCICCQQFNRQLSQIELFNEQRIQILQSSSTLHFWNFFQKTSLERAMIEFDKFFVGYVESCRGNTLKLGRFTYIIVWFCESLLQELMKTTEGRDFSNLKYTLEVFKERREKITIREILLMPYLAEKVFKCEMKKVQIDKNLYKKYFKNKKNIEYAAEKTIEEDDDFEIGEKETNEDVSKIGKSFMNLKFISGFMPKKK